MDTGRIEALILDKLNKIIELLMQVVGETNITRNKCSNTNNYTHTVERDSKEYYSSLRDSNT